jgi:hypothetical protein
LEINREGFKVADIDAILITHAHNDHTVDFESILTLIYKYNDAIEDSVKHDMKGEDEIRIKHEVENRLNEQGKKIDLFLNVGTFMKYSGWLKLSCIYFFWQLHSYRKLVYHLTTLKYSKLSSLLLLQHLHYPGRCMLDNFK